MYHLKKFICSMLIFLFILPSVDVTADGIWGVRVVDVDVRDEIYITTPYSQNPFTVNVTVENRRAFPTFIKIFIVVRGHPGYRIAGEFLTRQTIKITDWIKLDGKEKKTIRVDNCTLNLYSVAIFYGWMPAEIGAVVVERGAGYWVRDFFGWVVKQMVGKLFSYPYCEKWEDVIIYDKNLANVLTAYIKEVRVDKEEVNPGDNIKVYVTLKNEGDLLMDHNIIEVSLLVPSRVGVGGIFQERIKIGEVEDIIIPPHATITANVSCFIPNIQAGYYLVEGRAYMPLWGRTWVNIRPVTAKHLIYVHGWESSIVSEDQLNKILLSFLLMSIAFLLLIFYIFRIKGLKIRGKGE